MRVNPASVLKMAGSLLLLVCAVAAQRPGGPRGGPGGPGGPGGFRSPILNALDTNRDGILAGEEIAASSKNLLKADLNGDGAITPDELQPPPETPIASPDDLASQLMSFDKNGDGVLNADELPARMQSMFARADANHDNKLTRDEIRGLAARQTLPTGTQKQSSNDPIFLALDIDHDGSISASEIAAAATSLMSLDKDRDGEISAAELRPPPPTAADQANHFLGENDTDKDGRISKAEVPEWLESQFDRIDKNADGFLEADELTAYFGSNQGGGRGGRAPMGAGRPNEPGDGR